MWELPSGKYTAKAKNGQTVTVEILIDVLPILDLIHLYHFKVLAHHINNISRYLTEIIFGLVHILYLFQ